MTSERMIKGVPRGPGVTDILPQNHEAEESVLGAILVMPKVFRPVLHLGLRSEHFYRDRHRGDLPGDPRTGRPGRRDRLPKRD